MFPIYSFPNNLYRANYQPAPASLSRPYYDDDLEYLQDLSRRKAALEAEEQRICRKYQLRDQQRARDRAYLESIREQEAARERQLRLAQAEALRARHAAQQQSREREELVRALFSREADLPVRKHVISNLFLYADLPCSQRARADLYQQPYVQSYQPVYIQPAEELLNPITGYGPYQAPVPLRAQAPHCRYDPSQQQANSDPVLEALLSQRQPTRSQVSLTHYTFLLHILIDINRLSAMLKSLDLTSHTSVHARRGNALSLLRPNNRNSRSPPPSLTATTLWSTS